MKTILKNLLLLTALGCAAAALAAHWPEVRSVLNGTRWAVLAVAAAGLLVYHFGNAGAWSLVLGALGKRAGFWPAARVWVESEALRWLPGGIWGYGSRVVSAGSLGVGKATASAGLAVELILTNVAWAAVALVLVVSPVAAEIAALVRGSGWSAPAATLAAILTLVGGAILAAPAGRRAIGKVARPALARVPWGDLRVQDALRALAAYTGLCIFNGCLLWLTARAVPGLDLGLPAAIGAAGAAWLAGFWAIGVPGGIGVREAALCWLLAHAGSLEAAIAVAVLWRGLQVGAEIMALATVALSREIIRRRGPHRFGSLRLFNV